MENNFIQKAINMTGLLALLVCVAIIYNGEWLKGIGFLLGAIWGCANLYFLKKVLQFLLIKQGLKLYIGLAIKFPLLYLVGWLSLKFFPPFSLMAGFSLVLIVIFLLGLTMNMKLWVLKHDDCQ